jgi:prefoldin subunit 5
MASNWKEYEEEVASFFRSIGCQAEIQTQLAGARATHAVDVCVTFRALGVWIMWIVECKFWKSSVPKEKVLALSAIAQDVGADRAFLLSESGFQAGAIRAAGKTTITLSNLADLRANAQRDILDQSMQSLARRAHHLQSRLHAFSSFLSPRALVACGDWSDLLARLFLIKTISLPHAQAGEFPIMIGEDHRRVATAEESVTEIANELDDIENRLSEVESQVERLRAEISAGVTSIADAVEKLLAVGEEALFPARPSESNSEDLRLTVLDQMKALDVIGRRIRDLTSGEARAQLQGLMRGLIDGAYADLSRPTVARDQWDASVGAARAWIRRLRESAGLKQEW